MNAMSLDEKEEYVSPLKLFILSQDTLRGTRVNQNVEGAARNLWPDRPPLFSAGANKNNDLVMKRTCRSVGVPPPLRCAVWISAVHRSAHPQESPSEADECGTLGRVRLLDHSWTIVLQQVFPDSSDELTVDFPDLGLSTAFFPLQQDGSSPDEASGAILFTAFTANHWENLLGRDHGGTPIPEKGVKALKQVLCAAQFVLGVDFCPLLPDLVAILLNYMTESYVYATLRDMMDAPSFFLPLSFTQHIAWCRSFAYVLKRLHPETAAEMNRAGALSVDGLDPIFKRFFTNIMKYEHVLRICDMFVMEGGKVLFRMGVALIAMCKGDLKKKFKSSLTARSSGSSGSILLVDSNPDAWWDAVRTFAHSSKFSFATLLKKAFGTFHRTLNKERRQMRFPRRNALARMISIHEEWAIANVPRTQLTAPPKPLGFVESADGVSMVLAKPASVRASLASWLPLSLRSTKLNLIFSTDSHGRTLDIFYRHCSRTKHTITIMEVLNTGSIIGMFASQAWHNSSHVYGDGECFLFRASPNPQCFKWKHDDTIEVLSFEEDSHDGIGVSMTSSPDQEVAAVMEHFMVSRSNFISMGGTVDGSSGLRLNEDLSTGESACALGFNNDPLGGPDQPQFEIGLVEVYGLVREMDGRAVVDGANDQMWDPGF